MQFFSKYGTNTVKSDAFLKPIPSCFNLKHGLRTSTVLRALKVQIIRTLWNSWIQVGVNWHIWMFQIPAGTPSRRNWCKTIATVIIETFFLLWLYTQCCSNADYLSLLNRDLPQQQTLKPPWLFQPAPVWYCVSEEWRRSSSQLLRVSEFSCRCCSHGFWWFTS